MRAGFGLTGAAHKPLTFNTWWDALGFLAKLYRFFGEAIF
jgi:hypothetical protein